MGGVEMNWLQNLYSVNYLNIYTNDLFNSIATIAFSKALVCTFYNVAQGVRKTTRMTIYISKKCAINHW